MMRYWMGPYGYGYNGFFGGGSIFEILWFLLAAFLVILLLRRLFWRGPYMGSPPFNNHDQKLEGEARPLDILKKRYARGEITKKEFEEMKKDIA